MALVQTKNIDTKLPQAVNEQDRCRLTVDELLDSITSSEASFNSNDNNTVSSEESDEINLKPFLFDNLSAPFTQNEEDTLFAEMGYRKLGEIISNSQGQGITFKAEQMRLIALNYPRVTPQCYISVKKMNKKVTKVKIACNKDENIVNEAIILSHLTVDNKFINNNLIKFVDFFESKSHYYLVSEFIEGMTLKEFIQIAHGYIKRGKLKMKQYQHMIRYIMWNLCTSLLFLHNIYHCCHLNLLPENVLLPNMQFIQNEDGSISLPSTMNVKLGGFGVAEIFDISKRNKFQCAKHVQSKDNQYDARSADMWSFGLLFYQCMTGQPLHTADALQHGDLKQYLMVSNLSRYFSKSSMNFLCDLLNITERKRTTAFECMKSEYFKRYYAQNGVVINKKMKKTRSKLKQQREKMAQFPYYKIE